MPPFLRRANGAVEQLETAGGLPLGLMEDAVHVPATVDLGPGDQFLIITDGVTEAMAPSGGFFGEARVAELLGHCDLSEATLLHQLMASVRVFEAGNPQSDDIAAILLKLGNG